MKIRKMGYEDLELMTHGLNTKVVLEFLSELNAPLSTGQLHDKYMPGLAGILGRTIHSGSERPTAALCNVISLLKRLPKITAIL